MVYLFNVLARYLVPFLFARDGYFFCRKACSSRMESPTNFFWLMSNWLLGKSTKAAIRMCWAVKLSSVFCHYCREQSCVWARDVPLIPVNYSNNTQFDRDDSAHQNIHGICAGVHKIQLGHHSEGPPSWTEKTQPWSSNTAGNSDPHDSEGKNKKTKPKTQHDVKTDMGQKNRTKMEFTVRVDLSGHL